MGARWRCQLPWDDKSRARHSMSLLGLYVRYFEKGGKLTTFPSRFYSLVERSWGFICLFFEEVGRERAMHLFSVTTMKHIQRSYQTSTAHQCTRVNAPSRPTHAHTSFLLKCGPGSKFLGSFMLIPVSISGVNKPLQLRLMRLYHREGSSEVGWWSRGGMTQPPSY